MVVTAVEKIEWRTYEKGHSDPKLGRKSAWQGAAIGAGVGTTLALLLDSGDLLTIKYKKLGNSFLCSDDTDDLSWKCQYSKFNFAYFFPPLTTFIGYIIGREHAANIKIHTYSIMRNRDILNSMRREVPLVSVSLSLD